MKSTPSEQLSRAATKVCVRRKIVDIAAVCSDGNLTFTSFQFADEDASRLNPLRLLGVCFRFWFHFYASKLLPPNMTYPQSDQSSPVENTLAISATKATPESASEASRQSYEASQERFCWRTVTDRAVNTTASLSAAYLNWLSDRLKHTYLPLSPSSSVRTRVPATALS